jgi:microcystin-dependent protein
LPNLQGMAAVGQGQGPGLSSYALGQMDGTENVTLLQTEMPIHTHGVKAVPDPADQTNPGTNRSLARSAPGNAYQSNANANVVQAAPEALAPAGGSAPHNNMPPVTVMNFIIALQGVFPPR